jgi:cell division protein ftsZ (fragment)
MKGAKGVLINITGGSDITLMEIDEAVNIIREEVDENAEIIFGSSYDDSLSGRIRVSIVVTGIDDEATMQVLKTKDMGAYVDLDAGKAEDEEERREMPEMPLREEITVEETVLDEAPIELDNVVELTAAKKAAAPKQEEFAALKGEEENEEAHPSSALFNAIINKPVVANAEEAAQVKSELAEVKVEKAFAPTARVKIIEEEPQLFPEQGEVELPRERRAREEAQAMIQEEPEEPTRQRFIDKILGISRAKAKKPVKPVVVPKFDEIEDFAEKENDSEDDLEIPSFLRRR